MNDEAWLRDLAQAVRDEEEAELSKLDERWDRLAAGELSAQEEDELRALAETDPAARQAYEAFRPLGSEFKEDTRKKIVRVLPWRARWFSTLAAAAAALGVGSFQALPRPLPGQFRRFAGWSAAAAAGAAVAWLGLFRAPSIGSWAAFEPSPGDGLQRSLPSPPPTSIPVYHPGTRLHFGLEPKVAGERCERDLVVECYLAGTKELRLWQGCAKLARFDACGRGGFVDGAVGDAASDLLPLQPGESKLWAVVGRKGKLPGVDELRKDLLGAPAGPCSGDDRVGERNWRAICVQSLRMEGGS